MLCEAAAQPTYARFLELLVPTSGRGCCTNIWKQGAIAYRCRTCQLTTSAAICGECFKAGGCSNHDYVMYR